MKLTLPNSKLFLFATLFLLSFNVNAGHILGTRITYNYVSANTYSVKVHFYRDCQGLPVFQPATLCYRSASLNLSGSVQLPIIPPSFILPDFPYFPPMVNSCNGGPGLGIERITFEGNVVLPAAATDWVLSYSTFPMNIGIGQNFMYVSTKIDNVNNPVNSSANYLTDPTYAFCTNQPAWDNFACTDSDGDSLSYHLITVLDNDDPCPHAPFQSPVPAFPPLQSSTPIVIDSTNGSLTFTPTLVGQAIVSVRVDEHRNGTVINSSTVEHVMYLVTNCTISGLNDIKDNQLKIYPNPVNEKLAFEFSSDEKIIFAEVSDFSGKIFSMKQLQSENGKNEINVAELASGIYSLRVVSGNKTSVTRFVKN